MEININSANKAILKKSEVQQTSKPEENVKNENSSYNQSSLDKMAAYNRTMVKKPSFGGWKPESKANAEIIKQMVDVIKSPDIDRIAVSGHQSPDGDSIGSCFACASLLHQVTGKDVDCFIFGPLPKRYEYLKEGIEGINVVETYANGDAKYADKMAERHGKYDLAVSVDTSVTRMMSQDYYEGIYKKAEHTLKIDHHPYIQEEVNGQKVDNNYADLNLIDASCGAATQLLMQFAEPLGLDPKELSKTFNNAVFTGLLTDTGGLKFSQNVLPFTDAALLIENGVNNREMQNNALGNTPQCVRNVTNLANEKVQFSENGKVAFLIEDKELAAAKKEAKAQGYFQEAKDAIKGVAGAMPEIQGVEVGFKASPFKDQVSISIRSLHADVSELARRHGGGGHENAAAFSVKLEGRSVEEAVMDVVNECNQEIEEQGY
ncbi:DHH family phosphoesterase [bacterium]|nr:DHH family phosphoesterase [bacterium]